MSSSTSIDFDVQNVAPLAGSVDRNFNPHYVINLLNAVAPLAGSVDRNSTIGNELLSTWVAPLAGSVDRNLSEKVSEALHSVAPLAGSVDRNTKRQNQDQETPTSLPSRGAWIES